MERPVLMPDVSSSSSSPTGTKLDARTGRGSVDLLGQVHDEPFGSAHGRHTPDALVLADAADQVVAVRSEPIEDRLKVVYLKRDVAQPQFVMHGITRTWFVV